MFTNPILRLLCILSCLAVPFFGNTQTLFVGTYTQNGSYGIYQARFNAATGKLTIVDSLPASQPSYLAINRAGTVLVAVQENGGDVPATVVSFTKNKQGKWQKASEKPTEGDHPCFISFSANEKFVVTANYTGGSLTVFPIKPSGEVQPFTQKIQHTGSSVNAQRQQAPHVHTARFTPDGQFLMVADLGTDEVIAYPFDATKKQPIIESKKIVHRMAPGAGPRHLEFSNRATNRIYVLEELSGKVSVLRFDGKQFKHLQTVAADRVSKQPGSADIHLHPSGNWLFASNRADANSISVFKVNAQAGLQFQRAVSSGGIKPRNFTVHPGGKWVLAANQQTGNIVPFRFDAKMGTLTQYAPVAIPSPVCLVWQAEK